jgi:hypothetical protein
MVGKLPNKVSAASCMYQVPYSCEAFEVPREDERALADNI